ncbi:hypothetical protein DU478_16620 [Thalassococcus profundi]|uniref:Uncharacterized protein n=1 Tax=Thalassococcus profundi TaxID=2282382 RepID=A0A369TI82_9RHOB|nr:hypothetical protein DU478_16620 [Thalassococcus profundi]
MFVVLILMLDPSQEVEAPANQVRFNLTDRWPFEGLSEPALLANIASFHNAVGACDNLAVQVRDPGPSHPVTGLGYGICERFH